ncbi:prolactin family 4 subfamily a member 1 [Cricetulus griseus]
MLDQAIKLSQDMNLRISALSTHFNRFYASGRGFHNRIIKCHTSPLSRPENKEQAQNTEMEVLLKLTRSLLQAWVNPLHHLWAEMGDKLGYTPPYLTKALEIKAINTRLLEAMKSIIRKSNLSLQCSPITHMKAPEKKPEELRAGSRLQGPGHRGLGAVSYTHLEVYKRQQRGRRLKGELELGEQRRCLSRSCERGAASKAQDTGASELPGPPKPSPRQGSPTRPAPPGTAPQGRGRATSTRWAGPSASTSNLGQDVTMVPVQATQIGRVLMVAWSSNTHMAQVVARTTGLLMALIGIRATDINTDFLDCFRGSDEDLTLGNSPGPDINVDSGY